MIDLGTLGGSESGAGGINALGQVVGWSDLAGDDDYHAFLYSGGAMVDLNSLIDPNSGWTLFDATGINDRGQIVGGGTNALGEGHAYLLTPVPEPPSVMLLGLGLASIGGVALRCRTRARVAA